MSASPHWLQAIYWLSQIGLLFVAISALFFAYHEVSEARTNNRENSLQAKASFLMTLDGRWDSQEMIEARHLFYHRKELVENLVAENHRRLDNEARKSRIQTEFNNQLQEMRENQTEQYTKLLRFCAFFETVGLMVKQGYVDIDEISSLFKGPILDIDRFFRPHIAERQQELGVPSGLFEHALNLVDSVKRQPD